MNFIPSNDNLLVEVEAVPEKRGSLYVPETANQSGVRKAKVLSVGPGKVTAMGRVAPVVTVGMTIWFGSENGVKIAIDGTDYVLVSETNIAGFSA